MNGFLLHEYEIMQNSALGANALWAFVNGFITHSTEEYRLITLWHLMSVLPLTMEETSRRVILKKRITSGLRSILSRDPTVGVTQNEVVFNIQNRLEEMSNRTFRSLNLAIACNLIVLKNGGFTSYIRYELPKEVSKETQDILKSAYKLGAWAGDLSDFEYFTVLGVNPSR